MAIANEAELLHVETQLGLLGIPTILFREPDLANQATSLCTGALPKQMRKHFRTYSLWPPDHLSKDIP